MLKLIAVNAEWLQSMVKYLGDFFFYRDISSIAISDAGLQS